MALLSLALLVGCGDNERDPEPRATTVEAGEPLFIEPAARTDLVAAFSDPFIRIETRGSRVEIFDSSASPLRSVVQARRRQEEGGKVRLTIPQGQISMELEIVPGRCVDRVTGETTQFAAYLRRPGRERLTGCARPA